MIRGEKTLQAKEGENAVNLSFSFSLKKKVREVQKKYIPQYSNLLFLKFSIKE